MREQTFLSNIPEVLYKYRIWKGAKQKRILTDNELFFPSADLFNDSFDASLPMQYERDELTEENILKKLILVGRDTFPWLSEKDILVKAKERASVIDFSSDDYWKKFHPTLKARMNEIFGIYSLTSNNNNLLMWSHYADSHRGYCIGFDKFELADSTRGMIGKVTYSSSFPKIQMFDENYASFSRILMTKSKHWEYEDEYRITKSDASRKVFKFKDTAIKEIIFGCKIDQRHRKKIISIAKAKSSPIKLFDCVIDDWEFKLNLIEIL